MLKIVVLLKQTFDTEEKIVITPAGVEEQDAKLVINPYDEYALEEAIRLREKLGGQVIALTCGPERSQEALRTALAIGADEAIRLDSGPLPDDSSAIAAAIAAALKPLKADLLLAGLFAVDSGAGSVALQIAERLGLPHASSIVKLTILSADEAKSLPAAEAAEATQQTEAADSVGEADEAQRAEAANSGDTAGTGQRAEAANSGDATGTGQRVETANSGDTAGTGQRAEAADNGDTAGTGQRAETADSGDTAGTGQRAEAADSGDTAGTGQRAEAAGSGGTTDESQRAEAALGWSAERYALVERDVEGDTETVLIPLPALLTAQQGLNEPRYPSLPGIMKAKRKPLHTESVANEADLAPRTVRTQLLPPPPRAAGKRLSGSPPEQAAALVALLHSEAKLL